MQESITRKGANGMRQQPLQRFQRKSHIDDKEAGVKLRMNKKEAGCERETATEGRRETEWLSCDAGGQADMAGALSRIKKGLALLPVLAGQTWQAF